MLQKLSKFEIKACLCWSLIILPVLRFYVKYNLDEFKIKIQNFNISKNDNFGPLEFAKFDST